MILSGYDNFDFSRSAGFTNGGQRAKHSGPELLAWYYCSQQFPQYDTVFTRVTGAELDALYDYYEIWLVPCLAALGGRPKPVSRAHARVAVGGVIARFLGHLLALSEQYRSRLARSWSPVVKF